MRPSTSTRVTAHTSCALTMYSYPNLIPLPASAVEGIVNAVEPFAFERLYSAWFDQVVAHDAKAAVARSDARCIRAIQGGL